MFLNDDIIENIVSFLSLRDKINVRIVSQDFKRIVKHQYINKYRLSNQINYLYQRETLFSDKLELLMNGMYVKKEVGIHRLFDKRKKCECVIYGCREKRLGYIYIKRRVVRIILSGAWYIPYDCEWVYEGRKIPYCKRCFANDGALF